MTCRPISGIYIQLDNAKEKKQTTDMTIRLFFVSKVKSDY